ncbi:DoxX family membrane protein [Streptomyces noursei]|nr:DoxX family membrane protein [Streptomyces noursei]
MPSPTSALRQLNRHGLLALRLSLGTVYVWFGALKAADCTPVGKLVRDAVPFTTPAWFVSAVGILEIVVGLWFLSGRRLKWLLPLFAAHMFSTFSVLVFLPGTAFQHATPWELTMTGEFVVKNLVLLSAGLFLCSHRDPSRGPEHEMRAAVRALRV